MFLRKPVFALPEPGNHEQYINAHYLAESGAGEWSELDTVTPGRIRRFLEKVEEYRGGKKGLIGLFVGEVMKETKGAADPKAVRTTLMERLDS